jgi:hypothetical protein
MCFLVIFFLLLLGTGGGIHVNERATISSSVFGYCKANSFGGGGIGLFVISGDKVIVSNTSFLFCLFEGEMMEYEDFDLNGGGILWC